MSELTGTGKSKLLINTGLKFPEFETENVRKKGGNTASFTGSANDNILPHVAIKAYVRICLASACLVCVRVQMWTTLRKATAALYVW